MFEITLADLNKLDFSDFDTELEYKCTLYHFFKNEFRGIKNTVTLETKESKLGRSYKDINKKNSYIYAVKVDSPIDIVINDKISFEIKFFRKPIDVNNGLYKVNSTLLCLAKSFNSSGQLFTDFIKSIYRISFKCDSIDTCYIFLANDQKSFISYITKADIDSVLLENDHRYLDTPIWGGIKYFLDSKKKYVANDITHLIFRLKIERYCPSLYLLEKLITSKNTRSNNQEKLIPKLFVKLCLSMRELCTLNFKINKINLHLQYNDQHTFIKLTKRST